MEVLGLHPSQWHMGRRGEYLDRGLQLFHRGILRVCSR